MLDSPIADFCPGNEFPYLLDFVRELSTVELERAVLTAEGFLPHSTGGIVHGISYDGRIGALVLEKSKFLDDALLSDLASKVEGFDRLVVYYFRSSQDFAPSPSGSRIACKRIPMDITI
jgi:hypothetical protein